MRRPKRTLRGRGGGRRRRAGEEPPRAEPSLPPWKAFVVQLTNDTEPDSGTFAGRVEHLGSGRRERFSSGKELVATLLRLLGEAEHGGGSS
jgi:hypothetical protein